MDACRNAEAVVIATEWKEFRDIDWQEIYDSMNKPAFVFDGRLLVDADKLRKIGFKVRLMFFLFLFLYTDVLSLHISKVTSIGRGERL